MEDRFKFKAYWKDTKKEIKDFMEEYSLEHLDDEDIAVFQCTGLKDKKDKLIYEGDILKYKGYYFLSGREKELTKVVEWCPIEVGFNIDSTSYEFKIIGNIYENPELLENVRSVHDIINS